MMLANINVAVLVAIHHAESEQTAQDKINIGDTFSHMDMILVLVHCTHFIESVAVQIHMSMCMATMAHALRQSIEHTHFDFGGG